MFWNATFAHSQTLKYPENLRYVKLSSSAIGISGCTFQVITCTISFSRPVLQIAKDKMSLTLPGWENVRV